MPRKLSSSALSTVSSSPRKAIFVPAERGDASRVSDARGNSRSSRMESNSRPTTPVAPRIATWGRLTEHSPNTGEVLPKLAPSGDRIAIPAPEAVREQPLAVGDLED